MRFKFFLLLITFSLFSCKDEITVITSKQPGIIAGTVFPKGSVAIVQLIQGEIIAIDTTFNGLFKFEDVPPGVYRLVIKAENFGTQKINDIKVEDGEGNDIGIVQLSKYPYPLISIAPFEGEKNINVFNESIIFKFEEGIDPTSLERGIKIEPYATLIESYSSSSNDYFNYKANFNFGTEYKLSLDSTVTTIYGEPLEFSFSTTFFTEYFILEHVDYPSSSNRTLVLYFNSEIAESFENFIKVEPSVSVNISKNTDSRYYKNRINITPVNGWKADQEFNISISKYLEEINGATLGKDTTISFTSEELKIVETTPSDGEYFVDTNMVIRIEPNYFLDQSTIKNAISITPNIDFTITTQIRYTETVFYIVPDDAFDKGTEYTVTIKSSLSDFYGVPMKEDYNFTFRTRE